MMKGVNFQFTATNKAAPAMQSFQNGLKGVSNQMRSATAANQSFMRGMNDNRRAVQQMGFQIADFSVQVAGGQNMMLAFAQQGGQILQFFGAFGAVAGAALAVFAAWAIATGAFTNDTEKLSDAMKPLNNDFNDYESYVKRSAQTTAELTGEFGNFASQVKGFSSFMAGVKLGQTMEDLKVVVTSLVAPLSDVKSAYDSMNAANAEFNIGLKESLNPAAIDSYVTIMKTKIAGFAGEAAYSAKMLGLNVDQAIKLESAVTAIGQAKTMAEMATYAADALDVMKQLSATGVDLPAPLRDAAAALDEIVRRGASAATNAQSFMNINAQMAAIELGHARAIGDAERARVAVGNQIYAGMLAVQGAHQKVATEVKKVEDGMSAAGIAAAKLAGIDFSNITGAADAALKMAQAIDYMSRWDVGGVSSGGGSSYLASQYAQYGAGRKAGETLAAERGSLFGVAKPFLTDKKTKSGGGAKEDPLAELQKQLTLETAILGKTEAQQRIIRALGPDWQKYGDVAITGLTAQIDAIEAFNQKMADQQSIANTIKSSMEDAFMGIVSGTMKAKDAFKSMAASVISELFRVLVVQRLVGSFNSATGTGTGIVGFLGKAFSSFEGGGFTGYGARSGGVDGKGGFPAILHPNETVMDHTQGQGSGVTVVQNNTFGSGVTRAEVQSMIPKIVDATKAAVLDARKRGGSYGSAFA